MRCPHFRGVLIEGFHCIHQKFESHSTRRLSDNYKAYVSSPCRPFPAVQCCRTLKSEKAMELHGVAEEFCKLASRDGNSRPCTSRAMPVQHYFLKLKGYHVANLLRLIGVVA